MKQVQSPEMRALVAVDRASATPLHRQLYDGLRRAILGGLLRAGQRVPSTRTFALGLGVSRLTVLTAYDQLLHEGYLEARTGSGTFVRGALADDVLRPIGRLPRGARTPRPTVAPRAPRTATVAREAGGSKPFRVGLPALDVFPRAEWARLVARRARGLSVAHMAYGDPAGIWSLRAAIAAHVRTSRAVHCEADHVLVVSGSQAALRLCAAVLLQAGDEVAMEEPGYPGARAALAAGGARTIPVRVDADGIEVSRLDAVSAAVRAVYVTPSHQYPLGVSMTAARRIALLDWARRRDAWIIEDDYDSEYRYVSRPLGALQGMAFGTHAGAAHRVIYIGTFSKVLFPALRVGYLVVPPALWERFVTAREVIDLFPPTLYQLALSDFLTEGHFARHLRRMRHLYLGRRDALLEGLQQHCDGMLAVENADAGLHVTTRLPAGVDDLALVAELGTRGLLATPLSPCYVSSARQPGLLLGFGGWREPALKRATRLLGEVLRARR